jgi:hypothetical protein
MRNSCLTILVFLLLGQISMAQQNLPLIKANSNKISIKDGDEPITKYWDYLTTAIKPVVYNVSKFNKKRKLTFYTDTDSISFEISPGEKYDFKVLLNSKDTCYAQISTIIPSYYKECDNCLITNDTIPFILGKDHYIHIKGKVNYSEALDLIFDTGASCVLLTETGLKKAKINLDGFTENQGTGGFTTEQTSSSNHLQLSALHWKNLPLLFIDYKGSLNADGVVGFNVFEDKVVEIDYNNSIMIIHSKLPLEKSGYTESKMRHNINGYFIQGTLNNGEKDCTGWFLFDTGGNLTVAVGGDFSTANQLYGTMKKLGSSSTSGTGSNILMSETDILPKLKLVDFVISGVPIQLQNSTGNFFGSAGIMGNGVLERFNVIIDYPNATIYLKPNYSFNKAFKKAITSNLVIGFASIPGLLILGFLIRKRVIKNKSN